MKKALMVMAAVVVLAYSAVSGAATLDFQAKVLRSDVEGGVVQPKVVGIYTFNGLGPNYLENLGRPFTVNFYLSTVGNWAGDNNVTVYDGSATISAGQTQVVTGTAKTGKITITYDAETGQIEAKFVLNHAPDSIFNIYANNSENSYYAKAVLASSIAF